MRHFLSRLARPWSNLRHRELLAAIATLREEAGRADERILRLEEQLRQGVAEIAQGQDHDRQRLLELRDLARVMQTERRDRDGHIDHYLPGRRYESFDLGFFSRIQAAQASAEYFNRHLFDKPVFPTSEALILHCLGLLGSRISLPLEFGVFSGRTVNLIADAVGPDVIVYGFDSFEGLPEAWRSDFREGHFARPDLPEVRANVRLIKGWFDETLPAFRSDVIGEGLVNFVHMDCDLYSSTATVLAELEAHLAPDAIVVFDEFFNYPGWERHEVRAFDEFLARSGRRFEFIGCVPIHQQVAIRFLP
ncbi:MAG: class I SAM-dependent methyltransferase [Paracoccus sp. (in: a-proteobacteria)]|uniref:class I SAM-dependent methyltransferase n=1 Tax=Paracoccus sp. TaxID=267 RepID=UPI0039E3A0DD